MNAKQAAPKPTFAERQQRAMQQAKRMELQRCPDCGKLCKWRAGNYGNRAACDYVKRELRPGSLLAAMAQKGVG